MDTPTPERPEQEREPDTKGCSHDWHHTDCPDCGARWEATARVAGWYPPEYGYRSTSAPPAPQQEGEREGIARLLYEMEQETITMSRQHENYQPQPWDGDEDDFWGRRADRILAALRARPAQSAPAAAPEREYPCEQCGKLRTEAEGGTTFTVCDECWPTLHPGAAPPQEKAERERLAAQLEEEATAHEAATDRNTALSRIPVATGLLRRAAAALRACPEHD